LKRLRASGPRGEITLLIDRAGAVVDNTPLAEAVERAMSNGLDRMEAIKQVARERGLAKRDVYQAVEERRGR
jgi:16S rRNA (cytidine1402-2'-O)-methyltransferase